VGKGIKSTSTRTCSALGYILIDEAQEIGVVDCDVWNGALGGLVGLGLLLFQEALKQLASSFAVALQR